MANQYVRPTIKLLGEVNEMADLTRKMANFYYTSLRP